jgi:hypothetical protein
MTTTFRAVVMFAVLVGLPAACIYYGPLPTGAQRVVDRVLAAAKESISWNKSSDARDRWVRVEELKPAPPRRAEATVVPAVHEEVVAPPALLAARGGDHLADRDGYTCAEGSSCAGGGAGSAARLLTLADRLDPLLARLRQLGAIEYALEHWGEGGKLYRFHCEMPVGATPLTQQFEAVTSDPQKSVEQVLAEVGSWQLSRQTSGM